METFEVDKTKRCDCFVSYHGSTQLETVAFPRTTNCNTVHDFVEHYLIPRLRYCDNRVPSVFQRSTDLLGRFSDVFNAILQLRGGGVALVLLTTDYLRDARCLAELRALLSLERLCEDQARCSEAITMRLVFLESNVCSNAGVQCIEEQLNSLYNNSGFRPFLDGLHNYVLHKFTQPSTLEHVADQIARLVTEHWKDRHLNLGKTCQVSFDDMQSNFSHSHVERLARDLEVRAGEDVDVCDVLKRAREDGTISFNNVDKLLQICHTRKLPEDIAAAIRSYRRKWCSTSWSWTLETRNTLNNFVQEARDLQRRQGNDHSRHLATPNPPQRLTNVNGGTFQSTAEPITDVLNAWQVEDITCMVLSDLRAEGASVNDMFQSLIESLKENEPPQ